MRILFYLAWSACIAFSCFGQVEATREIKKPLPEQVPSKNERQAQIAEAKRDALKHVTDLEKDIAVAKANNEDPEYIKEMESQLATMKKMLGVIDKAASAGDARPKKLPPAKTTEPRYISPFVPIPLKQPVAAPSKEQANDQLLWYTGRRIDANTLITVTRTVVRYDRPNNRVLVQPDQRVDSPGYYFGLVSTLAQTPRMKNDFAAEMVGIENSFFMFPEIKKAYDEYEYFKNRYYNIAKNTIVLAAMRVGDPLEILHEELTNYIYNLQPIHDIKLPPERPNNLCTCDEQERAHYEAKLVTWMEQDFWREETSALARLEQIYVHLTNSPVQASASAANIPSLRTDLIKAFNTIIERLKTKLEKLTAKYETPNIYVEEGLVMATLSFRKFLSQTTAGLAEASTMRLKRDGYDAIEKVENLVMNNTVFEKYMNDQKALLDYNVIFDYSLYLGHEYNKKLLRPFYNLKDNFFQTWVEGLKKFNRFTLTLKMQFQYTQTDNSNIVLLEANGNLESKPIIVSLARSTCSWYLYPTDVNHSDRSGAEEPFQIPVRVLDGVKKIYLKETRVIPYSGPANMTMVFPTFEISFCPGRNNDQALMDILRFSDPDLQTHENDKLDKVYTVDLLQFANKMFLGIKQVKENTDDLASVISEMVSINTGSVQLPQSTGQSNMDRLFMEHFMQGKKREAQMSLAQTTHTANTIFPFDAQNKFPVFVDKTHSTVDPGDKDKTWGINFTTGEITLKVVHTPLP